MKMYEVLIYYKYIILFCVKSKNKAKTNCKSNDNVISKFFLGSPACQREEINPG